MNNEMCDPTKKSKYDFKKFFQKTINALNELNKYLYIDCMNIMEEN